MAEEKRICTDIPCDELKAVGRDIVEIRRTIKCLHDSFMEYKPMLAQTLIDRKFWQLIREQTAIGIARSSVWAVIIAFAGVVVYAAHEYVRHLVGR